MRKQNTFNLSTNNYLIRRQQAKVIRRVGDDISLAARVARGRRVPKAVKSDAQHPVCPQRSHKQVSVLAGLAELSQRAIV